jgi:P4 family phage/plasmid primase-like protien
MATKISVASTADNIKYPDSTMTTNTNKPPTKKIVRNQLDEFLFKHLKKKETDEQPTNTRIGDKELNIFGGSYVIPPNEYKQFLDIYYTEVFEKKKMEYLTEKQLENGGPILVDVDLRFPLDVPGRVYKPDNIQDLVDCYCNELKRIYQFDEDTNFQIFVFEKETVNRIQEKNLTKDGIHLLVGIQADHTTQQLLRNSIVRKIPDYWAELDIQNPWEDVFDSCISTGKTNWQLFGSRKPGCDAYQLTKIFNITYDPSDGELMCSPLRLGDFNMKAEFQKLSARYEDNPSFNYKPEFLKKRQEFEGQSGGSRNASNGAVASTKHKTTSLSKLNGKSIFEVRNREDLDNLVANYLDEISNPQDFELKEAYDYTMILPEKYYGDGSYAKWIRVGFALKNMNESLFIVWIAFSAKHPLFDFTDIMKYYEMWEKFDTNNPDGLSKRSIMHWAKMDVPEEFKKVKEDSISYYIEQTLGKTMKDSADNKSYGKECGDVDLATVLYHLFKDEFICVSVKANIWYRYSNHRWVEDDSGTTLRKSISTIMRDIYRKFSKTLTERLTTMEKESINEKITRDKLGKVLQICNRLGNTNDKKNIMTESKELFYDRDFMEKIDTNPYLLCFNNGVIDFRNKIFRRGYPEDYITKSTHINYIEPDPVKHAKVIDELNDFMVKLFPVPELCNYMWEHLASTLIGTSSNQTFNMYIGVGQNGKSVLVSLMEACMGGYKGDVPLSLVTDRRTKIGGLAPELVALKGIRYAVMQEPSKGDRLNEGVMKQITSGIDPIQARAPFMPQSITFIPQFKLCVCSNEFMEIRSQDHGTWRRIRVVDFMSMFVDPEKFDPNRQYQYPLDKNIKEKFSYWKEVFMGMLVKKAYETNGNVKDCDIVMKASNSYRESQDLMSEFISDKLTEDPNVYVSKSEIKQEFAIWYESTYGKGGPSPKEVHGYLDKRYGKPDKIKGWKGAKISYDKGVFANGVDEGDIAAINDEYDL